MTRLEDYIHSLKQKKVLIFGLGLQGGGVGATKFFAPFAKEIRITDLKQESQLTSSIKQIEHIRAEFILGTHRNEDIEWADIIVVNQDVWNKAPNSPYIAYAQKLGKTIETETGLFFELAQCPIIGITGSRGKTTATLATARMLEKAGKKIIVGGNVPESETLNELRETAAADYAVLELSNFQLHGLHFKKLSPHIAVITSISPDHLISYSSMDAYVQDKKAIYLYQKPDDYLIVKSDDIWADKFAAEAHAKTVRFSAVPSEWKLSVPGNHNRENLEAVHEIGRILHLPAGVIKDSLTSFRGVAFRLETVREINGITFINDTTATTPTAAAIALSSFSAGKIIWIAGGNSKHLPQKELVEVAGRQIKNVVLLKGTGSESLKQDMKDSITDWNSVFLGEYDTLKQAVLTAYQAAQPGDVVLLSPGFTSFGMFANEFDRGRQFNAMVEEIAS